MRVCIFSFNRGHFLANAVASVEQCAPWADIAIFDDDSDDPDTVKVLDTLKTRYPVLQPGNSSTHKLGGLYGNMQSALEHFRDEPLLCYLQDDMQMVRHLEATEANEIRQTFADDPDLAFLQPCLLKGQNRERDSRTLEYDATRKAYFRSASQQSAGRHFSAVCLLQPRRLLEKQWQFQRSEPDNDRQAASLFGRMGHLYAPFAMWLPEVPAYRGKRKTLALRLAEKKRQCGLYPFHPMDAARSEAFRQRDPKILPVAEDFLECEKPTLPQPWSYYPMQGSWWLKKLNILELFLRRLTRQN